jgi:sugar lactone lactonase YvrE
VRTLSAVPTLIVAVAACRDADGRVVKSGDDAREQPVGVHRVGSVAGFQGPESVRYDADQDVFFVSNIVGFGSVKDGAGYISRVNAARLSDTKPFIVSGQNGATLDAPKGMAIQGDTLWVADIDVLRGFNRHTGAVVGQIDFKAFAVSMLNDVALAPDGTLRVTDTGIIMSEKGVLRPGGDKIFKVGPARAVSVLASGPQLGEPNGIVWDSTSNRWITVGFQRFGATVNGFSPAFDDVKVVSKNGGGEFDGVEVLPSGAIIYSCWTDSSIHIAAGGHDDRLIRYVPEPADIGYDSKRGVIAVPLVMMDHVEFFTVADSLTRKRQRP